MSITCTLPGMGRALAEMACGVALLFGIAATAHCNVGCVTGRSPAEVDAAYRAETVGCSVAAKTLAEAKECRRQVNRRYGLCERQEWPRISPCDD